MESQKLFSLSGRTAVVTGASGLLGRQHCAVLADAGATVVVADLDQQACDALAETLPGNAFGAAVDITVAESVRALAEEVMHRTSRVDILVNNAAINDMFENPVNALELSKFENYPLHLWQKSLEVNVTGTFLCCQILGAHMAAARRGSIVNIASTYGLVAPDQRLYRDESGNQVFYKSAAYSTTKGALIAFTRFLASYWGHVGVRVNTLSPGGVINAQAEFFTAAYSQRTPLGRMAAPADYQGALLFLASDASAYMTGANLVVDGGFTIW
jgi:NAD(P)-dependent dehydrogenase (short-subunit alcohol dehydrogenase family)